MRMWMCDPKIMCRQHLLGEYREIFAIVGSLRKKTSLTGYIRNNLIEPDSIYERWKELRQEMIGRGYKPAKPLPDYDLIHLPEEIKNYKVLREKSLKDLLVRCPDCRKRFEQSGKGKTFLKE